MGLVFYSESGTTGEAGDKYPDLDRFGRIVDQRWTLYPDPEFTEVYVDLDRFQYGYDRNGNRLYEENLLESSLSELYHDGGGYDSLDRLGEFSRGTLNGTKDGLTGSASRSQEWSLDALGNWDSFTVDGGTAQTRTHDSQNRITAVSGATSPTHSPNGETTRDETGIYLAYDAWGRLVEVNDGSAVISGYGYDALNRRITHDGTGLYYSDQWQVVEKRDTSSGAVEGQYVWSSVYVDAMVLRERDTDPNTAGLEERLYVTHDANFNITSIIGLDGSTWEVIERYVYDPYGERTVLNADWTVDTDALSDVVFVHGHQGGRHDLAVGLVDFRNRFLDTSLGRWTRQDPLGYIDGLNIHAYLNSTPSNRLDPAAHKALPPIGLSVDQPSTGPTTGPAPVPGRSFLPEDCACDFFDDVEVGQLPRPPFQPSIQCDEGRIGDRTWTLRMNGVCYYPSPLSGDYWISTCNTTACDGGCARLEQWVCSAGKLNPKLPFMKPLPHWQPVFFYEFGCGLAVNT